MKNLIIAMSLLFSLSSTAANHKEYAAKGKKTITVFNKENIHFDPVKLEV